jgi:hypothetical protein
MSTTFNASAFAELDKITTPNLDSLDPTWEYHDADDELGPISKTITDRTGHHTDIDPSRIKFFYTSKPKKDGGRFITGSIVVRDPVERIMDDTYDYFVFIYYHVWKKLDSKNKAIQLDKILCGAELVPGKDMAEVVIKKKAADSKEYLNNLHFFGPEDVLKSSEIVDMAVSQIIADEADRKKALKEQQKQNRKNKDDE